LTPLLIEGFSYSLQAFLLTNLQNNLKEFDRALKRRENEELRRKRLAYVGISLDNVLPNKEKETGGSGKHVVWVHIYD
jgi:remodeling and spacing factor 1